MKRVPKAHIVNLDSSIAPQFFQKIDDRFIYFDKINQHEGRLCQQSNINSEVLFEIGEGQVEILDNGEVLVFRYEDETTISFYSCQGELLKEISLKGIYFDVVKDSYGNYICLGNIDGKTVLKIINRMGVESATITPSNLLFGSCIQVSGDEILLGGFDENNCFKVSRFNYIGSKSGEWKLGIEGEDRVITKIIICGNTLLLSISGSYESLVVLDTATGECNEIYINELKLRYLSDFNVSKDSLFMLDGRCIHEFSLEDMLLFSKEKHKKGNVKEHSLSAYQYIMYSRGICDHIEKAWSLTISFLVAAAMIAFFYSTELIANPLTILFVLPCLFWILNYSMSITINMISFMDKSVRIDKLLSIYSRDYRVKHYKFPLYTTLLAECLAVFLSPSRINISYCVILGAVCYLSFYILEKIFSERIRNQNRDIIIELLQPEDDKFREFIQKSIEKFKRENCEKICVDIILQENLKDNILEKWAKSRSAIIRGIEEGTVQNNRITAVLDMSKRDIKYSRISIIMDYICFVKREVNIKEIEIAFKDDKS